MKHPPPAAFLQVVGKLGRSIEEAVDVDFEKIEAFLMVASKGKFTDAADQLFISQSALSKQMAQLENILRVKLFKKTRSGVLLTQAGHDFYAYARRALPEYQHAVARLQIYREGEAALLVVGALPLTEEYGLADMFSSYWVQNTSTQIEFIERSQENLLSRLRRRKVDLALLRVDLLDPHEISYIPLLTDELEVVCSVRHPLASQGHVDIKNLRNEHFIMLEEKSDIHQIFKAACLAAGFHPSIPLYHSRHRMILRAVQNDMGITVLPRRLLSAFSCADLQGVPFTTPIYSTLGLAWLASTQLSPTANQFIDFICQECHVKRKAEK